MAAQAGVSDTMEVTKATHMPVIICINSTDTKSPLRIFKKPREFDDYIGTVESEDPSKSVHFKEKYKTHFAFCVRGRVLRISPLRMKDFGTYSVKKSGKTSIFTLQTNKTMVNCKVHGSHRSCSCYLHYSPPDASFGNVSCTWDQRRYILQVNESSQNLLEMLMYRSQNTVTVTTPGVLRNENSTHSPSPGTQSDSIIAWSVASVLVLILLTFLRFICKLKCECGKPSLEPWGAGAVYCRKKRRRGSAGSQHDSHSAAGDHMIDIKRQAEESV